MKPRHLLFILIWILPQVISAEVKLNALFANRMVVQQDTEIPMWGWADPMEKITIETSWGEKVETTAKTDSTWRVTLKTPKAGGPFQITVTGKNKIVLEDVLSGEVWLCTGQSNMDFAMEKFVNDAREEKYQPLVEHIRKLVATENDPWIRHIEVPQTTSVFEKKKNFEADWRSVNPEEIGKITATGYFFAKELKRILNVPIGIVECSWGGTRIQPWLSEEAYKSDEELKEYFEHSRTKIKEQIATLGDAESYIDTSYQQKYKAWVDGGKKTNRPYPRTHPLKDKQLQATLHNGMISAIVPFAIKGVVWYQGEGNSHFKEEEYEKYFKLMINSWREEWGQGDFPFYWAQLAAYEVPDERSDNGWAMVNDHLRRGLELPNTGMAVLYDIGEAKDVHPHNKMDAGIRLSMLALKNDYGITELVANGPLYISSKVVGNKMIVEFKDAGKGLMVGNKHLNYPTKEVDEPLSWFEILDENGSWKPAEAKIIAKDKIEVSNPNIDKPVAVRYAWSSNPEGANLYNRNGLPAAVFTTEE
ncbi:sialate O-acetylesterase [uncultured Draconibacterium sp.]|uniref:sialate O-acetylesterase n=1 Tax=uncultured Draconibacterium sp. TaxID=1573823 RepID=UPI0029C869C3|nr:sialate O-acetylesterase [uncultured Draconibacterium sp.]